MPNLTLFFRLQILDSSQLKEFADDNFKFDENGKKFCKLVENAARKGEIARYDNFKYDENGEKFSKLVENTARKGENARYEQFLLFPVFSKVL